MAIEERTTLVNGIYKKIKRFVQNEKVGIEAVIEDELSRVEVTYNENTFKVDNEDIARMEVISTLASYDFIKSVAGGSNPQQAFLSVYRNTNIKWKRRNGNIITISVEDVCEILKLAQIERYRIWLRE